MRDRNRARIVDAARRLWLDDPDASMDAVARAAGVVRRTLYGHFATREELVVAVVVRGADLVGEFAELDATATPAVQLAAMCARLWTAGSELQLLVAAAGQIDGGAVADGLGRINQAMATVIAAGQRSGDLGDHLPPDVMATALGASAVALHAEVAAGRWDGTAERVVAAALIAAGVDPSRARELAHVHNSPDGAPTTIYEPGNCPPTWGRDERTRHAQ